MEGVVAVPEGEVAIQNIQTRFWCLVCGGNFLVQEEFESHYIAFHPKYKFKCGVCLNKFQDMLHHEFHTSQMHHKGVPYEFVKQAFGDALFHNISPKEFHRLMKNEIPVPENVEVPPPPSDDSAYLTIQEARYLLAENLELRARGKRVDKAVYRGVKQVASKAFGRRAR